MNSSSLCKILNGLISAICNSNYFTAHAPGGLLNEFVRQGWQARFLKQAFWQHDSSGAIRFTCRRQHCQTVEPLCGDEGISGHVLGCCFFAKIYYQMAEHAPHV